MSILSNPTVTINNNPIAIIPNSFKFKDGLGESQLRVESAGGSSLSHQEAVDVSTMKGSVTFEMLNTPENIESARNWKLNGSKNVVAASQGDFSRTFPSSIVTNDPEVSLSNEGNIMLEWQTAPAV